MYEDLVELAYVSLLAKYAEKQRAIQLEEVAQLFGDACLNKERSEEQINQLLTHSNPQVRLRLATEGYCPETLCDDVVAEVRLAVLKKTGVCSGLTVGKLSEEEVLEMLFQDALPEHMLVEFEDKFSDFLKAKIMFSECVVKVEDVDFKVRTEALSAIIKVLSGSVLNGLPIDSTVLKETYNYFYTTMQNQSFALQQKIETDYDERKDEVRKVVIELAQRQPVTSKGVVIAVSDDKRRFLLETACGQNLDIDVLDYLTLTS